MVQGEISKGDKNAMTNEEVITQNIGLTFDFLRYVIENPKVLDYIPDGAELELLSPDVPIPEKRGDARPSLAFMAKRVFEVVPPV